MWSGTPVSRSIILKAYRSNTFFFFFHVSAPTPVSTPQEARVCSGWGAWVIGIIRYTHSQIGKERPRAAVCKKVTITFLKNVLNFPEVFQIKCGLWLFLEVPKDADPTVYSLYPGVSSASSSPPCCVSAAGEMGSSKFPDLAPILSLNWIDATRSTQMLNFKTVISIEQSPPCGQNMRKL